MSALFCCERRSVHSRVSDAYAGVMNRSADSRLPARGPSGDRRPDSAPHRSPAPLIREVVGRLLRVRRVARGLTLADVADRAGISTQYLSEVERGLKDASSEMIAAISGALGMQLHEVLVLSAQLVAPAASAPVASLAALPAGPSVSLASRGTPASCGAATSRAFTRGDVMLAA